MAVGLYGVAALLLALSALGVLLAGRQDGRLRMVVRPLGAATGGLLLLRGIALQIILLADPAYGSGAVSPAERYWSLVLWNPWFIAGGTLFLISTAVARGRRRADGAHRRHRAT